MIWQTYFAAKAFISRTFNGTGFFADVASARSRRYRPLELRRIKQWEKFKVLLHDIYQNNQYYRQLCDEKGISPHDIKSFSDLHRLPVVTKEGIRSNYPERSITSGSHRYGLQDRTAGSTGNPLFFLRDTRALPSDNAAYCLARLDTGWKYGQREIILKATVPEGNWATKYRRRFGLEPERIAALELSPKTLSEVVARIESSAPRLLAGYPSAILLIAKYCHNNLIRLKVPKILTSGEILTDEQRSLIEDTLDSDVYRLYAASECMYIASECGNKIGYHVDLERFIVEVVDKDGMPVNQGQQGEILMTNLDNHCMPFIRYSLGDFGRMINISCPCGITGPVLTELHGKLTVDIVTPLGKLVSVHLFGVLFRDRGLTIDSFQIVHSAPQELTILVVPIKGVLDSHIKGEILSRLSDYLEGSMKIRLLETNHIAAEPSGKRPMLKRDFSFHFESA